MQSKFSQNPVSSWSAYRLKSFQFLHIRTSTKLVKEKCFKTMGLKVKTLIRRICCTKIQIHFLCSHNSKFLKNVPFFETLKTWVLIRTRLPNLSDPVSMRLSSHTNIPRFFIRAKVYQSLFRIQLIYFFAI